MKYPALATIALALLLGPLACTAANAQKGDDDWFRGRLFPPELVLKNASALKLTDSQRSAIRAEIVRVQTSVASVDVEIMEQGLQIQEAIDQLPVNRADVLARADKVFAAEARKKRAWIEMLVNIKNALTHEQVEQLRALAGAAKP
jgi:Spy/CpxP family protein refolding chaperone